MSASRKASVLQYLQPVILPAARNLMVDLGSLELIGALWGEETAQAREVKRFKTWNGVTYAGKHWPAWLVWNNGLGRCVGLAFVNKSKYERAFRLADMATKLFGGSACYNISEERATLDLNNNPDVRAILLQIKELSLASPRGISTLA